MVKPHSQGDATTFLIDSSMYTYHSFFSLDSTKVASVKPCNSWIISLDASPGGWRIYINSSSYYGVYVTGTTDFGNISPVTDPEKYIFDASSGHPDSTSFNSWLDRSVSPFQPTGKIFLIGKYTGINYNPEWMVKFISYNDTSYTFQFAPMGGIPVVKTIKKDPLFNRIYYHFSEGGKLVKVEPQKNSWDLLFTQYGTILYTDEGVPTPYFVRGVLINPSGVAVNKDTIKNFTEIDFLYASQLQLITATDIIGYDWKDVKVDFNSGTAVYITRSNVSYIIRDVKGYLYKIRFIDFYNQFGKEGYPSFEMQKL